MAMDFEQFTTNVALRQGLRCAEQLCESSIPTPMRMLTCNTFPRHVSFRLVIDDLCTNHSIASHISRHLIFFATFRFDQVLSFGLGFLEAVGSGSLFGPIDESLFRFFGLSVTSGDLILMYVPPQSR